MDHVRRVCSSSSCGIECSACNEFQCDECELSGSRLTTQCPGRRTWALSAPHVEKGSWDFFNGKWQVYREKNPPTKKEIKKRMSQHARLQCKPGSGCIENDRPGSCTTCNLFTCSVCGLCEGALTTECPGVPSWKEMGELVYSGKRDFINGKWSFTPSPHSPAGTARKRTKAK